MTFDIFVSLVMAGLRSELQYRANFLMMVLLGLIYQGTGFIFLWVVLSRFPTIAGWGLADVAFLYGLRLVGHALAALIFGRLRQLDWIVRQGLFDQYLVRPVSPLLQLVAERPQISALGDFIEGFVLLCAANTLVEIDWSMTTLAYAVAAILGGCLVESALRLAIAALSFRTLQTSAMVLFADNLFNNFGNYPLKIFGSTIEFLLTFGLPLAFVAYFPAAVLLHRMGELRVPPLVAELAPVAGVLWFSLAYWFWRLQIRNYQSAGH